MTIARNQELEAAIDADPDNIETYQVYADWLSGQGDPRGELISIQVKADSDDLVEHARAILEANEWFVGGLDDELFTLGWRWGFVDVARIFNYRDWMDDGFDVIPIVRRIFESPAAKVRELRLGVIRWMMNGEDVPNVLAEVARLGAAARVRRLFLGDVADIDCDLAHHPIGDLAILGEKYPRLDSLFIHGCDFELGALPGSISSLAIETCGLSRDNLKAITTPVWSDLARLELWFGSEDYGSEAEAADLERILSGQAIPRVTHLALANAELTDELCERLPSSAVLTQLETLDLSYGTMSDDGARVLAAAPEAFAQIKTLDVSDNYLSDDGLAALAALPCDIISSEQRDDEDDEGIRYVAFFE